MGREDRVFCVRIASSRIDPEVDNIRPAKQGYRGHRLSSYRGETGYASADTRHSRRS